jgi:hypothetical protein
MNQIEIDNRGMNQRGESLGQCALAGPAVAMITVRSSMGPTALPPPDGTFVTDMSASYVELQFYGAFGVYNSLVNYINLL